ncbi:amino acid permease-domain-containing protein [Globomyces pollinis-pini]|nr:amino acid permease-domain-containing protein [Globomyces pollinis-pini]
MLTQKESRINTLNERIFQPVLKTVTDDYIKKRALRDSWISKPHLILFGVGTVITGEFAAWNTGLMYGWGSMVVATILAGLHYLCLLLCLSELSSALPFSGGVLTITTASMGNVFGYIIGLVIFMQNLLPYSQTALLVSNYYMRLAKLTPDQVDYWKYIVSFIVILVNSIIVIDLKLFHRVISVLTCISILQIVTISFLMIPTFSKSDFWLNVGIMDFNSFLPNGIVGILSCMPFAIWFYVGVETLPNLTEEAKDASTNIPKGMLYGYGILSTLVVIVMTLVGCNPGIDSLQSSIDPLNDLLFINYDINPSSVFGMTIQWTLSLAHHVSTIGFSIACIRVMYSLSRGGYFPTSLSITYQRSSPNSFGHGSPIYAILASSVASYAMVVVTFLVSNTPQVSFLVYGSAFYTLTAAIFVFISYIILKFKSPHLQRPFDLSKYTNPYIVPILGIILDSFAIFGCFTSNAHNIIVFYLLVIQVFLSLLYYIFYVRHRLILSTEQKFIKLRISKMKQELILKDQQKLKKSGRSVLQ